MQFSIPPDHPSLPGHFPGHPIVPGVVVLDRVVEAVEAAHGPLGALRLPQVKFLQPLLPGEIADIRLESAPAGESAEATGRWRFRVMRGDALLVSGELVADPQDPTWA